MSTPTMSDNPRVMTRARTFAGLVAGLLLPVLATAQGANAKPDPSEAGNGRRMQQRILKGTEAGVERAAAGSGTLTTFHSTHEEMPCPH